MARSLSEAWRTPELGEDVASAVVEGRVVNEVDEGTLAAHFIWRKSGQVAGGVHVGCAVEGRGRFRSLSFWWSEASCAMVGYCVVVNLVVVIGVSFAEIARVEERRGGGGDQLLCSSAGIDEVKGSNVDCFSKRRAALVTGGVDDNTPVVCSELTDIKLHGARVPS